MLASEEMLLLIEAFCSDSDEMLEIVFAMPFTTELKKLSYLRICWRTCRLLLRQIAVALPPPRVVILDDRIQVVHEGLQLTVLLRDEREHERLKGLVALRFIGSPRIDFLRLKPIVVFQELNNICAVTRTKYCGSDLSQFLR